VTLFALLLTAYKVLLHRYTHQNDLIVGVPSSGRSQSRFAPVVGNFVNPLPLRSHPAGNKAFSAYLAEVNDALLSALEYQDFPFSLLVDRLQPERVADHWPIYQTLFVLQQAQAGFDTGLASLALGEDGSSMAWGDWQVHLLNIQQRVENFDLKLMSVESEEGLLFSYQYRNDLWNVESINRLASHFETLLKGIIGNPKDCLADLPLLTGTEYKQMLEEWNATAASYPENCCLHELFEVQASKVPQAVAVVCGEERISYRELNVRANYLAHYLCALGVEPEVRVGLCLERSIEAIIGILAILKSGGAYVFLDPGYPSERIADTLDDCGAVLLLTQERLLGQIKASSAEILCLDRNWQKITEQGQATLSNSVQPSNAAYLIYTSGSTGKAKGVVVSHGNAVASTSARFTFYPEAVDGFLLLSSFAFDSSVAGIFWTLSQGGRLCIPPEGSHQDPMALAEIIQREHLSHLLCLPSLYGLLLEGAKSDQLNGLGTVIVAGEACPPILRRQHFQSLQKTRLYNEYGPTEGTVWCSGYEIQKADVENRRPVFIGRPIANTKIYLLDAYFNPVPIGVSGELYISGAGVTRNYHSRPDSTAERFIPDPFGTELGERLYRTGDLVRWNVDGHLEFLGRVDHQVKIRGFRIELGEIEAWLREHSQIQDSVVIVREDHPGDRRLVAYFVPSPSQNKSDVLLGNEALRVYLNKHLPDYMVPAAFVSLDALLLTANGKTDRQKLPAPDWSGQFACDYKAPGNAVEAMLAEIWAEVLRVERVGVHDNFFSLGGESILAIQVAIRAHKAGLSITPRQLFQHQTVAELALVAQPLQPSESAAESEQALSAPSTGRMDKRFPLSRLEPDELADLAYDLKDIEDIYPLTPMQEGMLFHTLMAPHTGVYLMQDRFELEGRVNVDAFHEAWNHIIGRHTVLRTSFFWETKTIPHQIVHKNLDAPFEYFDWCDLSKPTQELRLAALLRTELTEGFDLMRPPLLRFRLFRVSKKHYWFVRSHHHILLDAWCTSLILTEFKSCYDALVTNNTPDRTAAAPFSNYIAWLQKQDAKAEERFWGHYLAKFDEPTPLVVDCPLVTTEQSEVADIAIQLSRRDAFLSGCLEATAKGYRQHYGHL
jgi:amino acid adenylation domain-containing protein